MTHRTEKTLTSILYWIATFYFAIIAYGDLRGEEWVQFILATGATGSALWLARGHWRNR